MKVAVAGDGADELFGSYLSHRLAAGAQHDPDISGRPDADWRADLFVMSDEEKRSLYSEEMRPAFAAHFRRAIIFVERSPVSLRPIR